MRQLPLIIMLVVLAGCHHESPAMHDHFHSCVAPDGRQYMVEYGRGECRVGDDDARCVMPNGTVTDTRGQQACITEGGRPLGRLPSN